MMRKLHTLRLYLALAAMQATVVSGQSANGLIREGNERYAEEKYPDAEVNYRKGLDKDPASAEGPFNLGDALYRQERYEDAAQLFSAVAETHPDDKVRARAYHNLGNALLKAQKIEESIAAYKKSLLINPRDMDTKYNLAFAQSLLQKKKEDQGQEKQQQEQQDQQQKKDQQQQQQQELGENKEDRQKEAAENQEQAQEQQKKQEEQPQPKPEQGQTPEGEEKEAELSMAEAERILDAVKSEEKNVQKAVVRKKVKAETSKVEKDW